MELDSRPHRTTTTTTSELFICFTSLLSNSSSMRLSSAKSILSPARTDKTPVSLSTSLSRRLRTNGSLKGGQSPMFPPSVSKKRGCAFENPEPSSPKVTCIGQVRVKTKKQGRKMKMIRACGSKKRLNNGGGEVSFRNVEHAHDGLNRENSQSLCQQQQQHQQDCLPHRNQKWVHLPLTICEALRGFGAEFNCFLPCKSSCFSSSEREKVGKGMGSSGHGGQTETSNSNSSCGGAVFRWLVALHEGEGKTRDIELVVGGEEDAGEEERGVLVERESSRRRSIFDDMEFKDEICEVKNEYGGGGGEEPRVSICIPPKNALLLMRCRSDPMRMAALANKFWDSSVTTKEDENGDVNCNAEEEDDEEEDEEEVEEERGNGHEQKAEVSEVREELEEGILKIEGVCEDLVLVEGQIEGQQMVEEDLANFSAAEVEEQRKVGRDEEEEQISECKDSHQQEASEEQDTEVIQFMESGVFPSAEPSVASSENLEDGQRQKEQNLDKKEREATSRNQNSPTELEENKQDHQEEEEEDQVVFEEETILDQETSCRESIEEERENEEKKHLESQETMTQKRSEENKTTHPGTESEKLREEADNCEEKEEENEQETKEATARGNKKHEEERESSSALPDCLLLMMCEPKLSMEVSKETWVCSTDFIRWLPERHQHHNRVVKPTEAGDELKNGVGSTASKPLPVTLAPVPAVDTAAAQQLVFQPPRSSCSFPVNDGVSMASVIEQKLVNAVGYEPFVLTRCKSAPMRSSAKLAPELACFWKNRKLEPHRPATFGVGAAGVGF
ncbi:hypothetical protein Ancab_025512 [Ancistrocladus abbreviatus]